MTYQIKLVDTNGRAYATQVGQANTRKSHSDEHADAAKIERMLQHPEDMRNKGAIIRLARHDERAIDFVLRNTHREGGLRCAITLAEQACPVAKEYIRDFCALIRLADRGNPHVIEALYAHKDYNLDCRNRIMRLFAAKQQEVKHAMEGCRGGGIVD